MQPCIPALPACGVLFKVPAPDATLSASPSVSLPPVTYKGLPVCTTEMLAEAYGCTARHIKQNFANNRDRFVEGKHFVAITNGEIKDFALQVENFDLQISPKTRHLTLWLERGAACHAKMLNTDKAWDVFELLEETFFRVAKPEALPDSITPDQQCTLQAIVKARIEALPEAQRKGRGLYPQIWSRFNNHFRLARYCQLPQCRMSEAVAYLTQMELTPAKNALPLSRPLPRPALPQGDGLPPEALDAMTDSRRAKRFRRLMEEVRGLAQKVGSTGARYVRIAPELDARYNALDQMHKIAVAGLYQAEHMLYCLYFLGEGVEFR